MQFRESVGGTCAGAVATVAQPVKPIRKRKKKQKQVNESTSLVLHYLDSIRTLLQSIEESNDRMHPLLAKELKDVYVELSTINKFCCESKYLRQRGLTGDPNKDMKKPRRQFHRPTTSIPNKKREADRKRARGPRQFQD